MSSDVKYEKFRAAFAELVREHMPWPFSDVDRDSDEATDTAWRIVDHHAGRLWLDMSNEPSCPTRGQRQAALEVAIAAGKDMANAEQTRCPSAATRNAQRMADFARSLLKLDDHAQE
jgi:hypothetical protein